MVLSMSHFREVVTSHHSQPMERGDEVLYDGDYEVANEVVKQMVGMVDGYVRCF